MKLQITAGKLPLAGTVENLLEKHLNKDLNKFIAFFEKNSEELTADVKISKDSRWGYNVVFDLHIPGAHIYSQEKHQELPIAITIVRDEVKRQLQRVKEKIIN